jgi:hypothetical protein
MENDYLNEPYFAKNSNERLDYLLSLVSKQYEVYGVCESKVNALITISAIFIGATVIFIDKGTIISQAFNIVMILVALLPFLISLGITIWYVGPEKSVNPKWRKVAQDGFFPNHRAVSGIIRFKSVEKYNEYLSKLTKEDICDQIISQIYVTNDIIWHIQKVIKVAAVFNIIGLLGFITILIIQILFK